MFCIAVSFVCTWVTVHHLFRHSPLAYLRGYPFVLYLILVSSNSYISSVMWMAQVVLVLIWKGDVERFSCLPRPHHKLAEMTSLLLCYHWPIWWGSSRTYFQVRSSWSFFFKLLWVGAVTVTITEDSFAILLIRNLAFRFILLRLHIKGILLHISLGKPCEQIRSDQFLNLKASVSPASHFTYEETEWPTRSPVLAYHVVDWSSCYCVFL